MKKNIIILIIIIALALVGFLLFMGNSNINQESSTNQLDNQQQETSPTGDGITETSKTYEVIYTDSGYSHSELTNQTGDTVVWKNQSSGEMWTASAMHPTHIVYSQTSLSEHCPDPENTSFDQCKSANPGESWSFMFEKTGTWGYHNHVGNNFGKIIVQ